MKNIKVHTPKPFTESLNNHHCPSKMYSFQKSVLCHKNISAYAKASYGSRQRYDIPLVGHGGHSLIPGSNLGQFPQRQSIHLLRSHLPSSPPLIPRIPRPSARCDFSSHSGLTVPACTTRDHDTTLSISRGRLRLIPVSRKISLRDLLGLRSHR